MRRDIASSSWIDVLEPVPERERQMEASEGEACTELSIVPSASNIGILSVDERDSLSVTLSKSIRGKDSLVDGQVDSTVLNVSFSDEPCLSQTDSRSQLSLVGEAGKHQPAVVTTWIL